MDRAFYTERLRAVSIAAIRTLEQWSAASALGAFLLCVALLIAVVIAVRVTLRR